MEGIVMASNTEIILVCDFCGTEDKSDMVETHRVTVDGTTREAELCAKDWSDLMTAFVPFAKEGREPEKRKVKKSDILQWPDTPWKFTRHAMLRMGERGVSPVQVLKVIAGPEMTTPGRYEGEQVWVRDGIKVVVHPEKQHILTASKRNSDYDDLQAVG